MERRPPRRPDSSRNCARGSPRGRTPSTSRAILRLVISSLVFLYLLPDALRQQDTLPLYVMGIHLWCSR